MSGASATTQLRDTAIYIGTIATTQLASFALLPIITRFLGPSTFGEYALALSVSGLVGMISTSWVRNVAFRYYYEERAAGRTRPLYLSIIVMQFVLAVTGFGIAALVLPLFDQDVAPLHTLLAAAVMITFADLQALTLSFLRAEERSGRYAAAEITAALTRVGGTFGGLIIGFREPAFLFLAAAAASLAGAAIAYFGLSGSLQGPSRLSLSSVWKISRHMLGAMPFSIGTWLGRLSDRLVLNAFTTTAVVGVYSAGFSLGDGIIGGLVLAVFMMANPDILNSFTRGGYAVARYAIKRYFQIYLWLTVGPLVVIWVFGEFVVSILGSSFSEATQVLGLIATAAWLRGMSNGFNRHFELNKRFYALSAVTVIGAITNLGLNLLLVPKYLAVGAGMAALGAQILVLIIYVFKRERELVTFPATDALLVLPGSIGLGFLLNAWIGATFASVALFTSIYVAVLALVWTRRIKASRTVGGEA